MPCGPVQQREEWFGGETIAANEMRVELQHAELGAVDDAGRLHHDERDAGDCTASRRTKCQGQGSRHAPRRLRLMDVCTTHPRSRV